MPRSIPITALIRFVPGLLSALAIGSAPQAVGQSPFEQQRPPQAPLEHPVKADASIMADARWTYHLGLNQTIATQRQTQDRHDDGPMETTRLVQNATVTLRVVSIDPGSGVATVEARFERLLVVAGVDDSQSEFRWSAGSEAAEPATGIDRLLTALAGATLTARVSPRGSVRGVIGYDAVHEALKENPEIDQSAMGLFAPSAIGSTLELLWKPGEIAGSPRNVGDAWTSVRRATLGHVGGVAVEHAFKIDRIEDGVLKAQSVASLRLTPPSEAPSAGAPVIELLRDEGRMKIAWDLARGCSLSVSERLDLGALWSLGQVSLGVTMRTERSVALDTPPAGTKHP
jgi:hypothetical protein